MTTIYEIEFINTYRENMRYFDKEEAIKWAKIYRANGENVRLLEIVAKEMEF
jgi:hypothetical protein